MNYDTLEEAGYKAIEIIREGSSYGAPGEYLLTRNDGKLEVWFHNQNHASYGIIYKGRHLEFARSIPIDR